MEHRMLIGGEVRPTGVGEARVAARSTRRWLVTRPVAALAAGGAAHVLASCGAQSQAGTTPPKKVSGPKEISYASWSSSLSSPAAEATRNAFSEQFGGVKFEEQVVPWGEYINKQIVLMASGSAPDVVASENEQFPAFAKGNLFKPLGPFFNRDKSIALNDFFPQLRDGYTYKAELYCLPADLAPVSAVFANKRLFQAAGLAMPSEKESVTYTWDRVIELAHKLTKADGSQYGLHVEYFETVPYSGGAYYVNDRMNPTRAMLDDARWARSFEMWVDWTTRQKVMPAAADRDRLGQKDWWALFAQGSVAMYITGPWQISRFLQMEPSLQWDMFWVPKFSVSLPRKFRTGGSGHGMSQNARDADLVWEWLKFNNTLPGYEIGQKVLPPEVVRLRAHIPSTELEVARLKKLGMTNIDILVKGAPDVLWWPFHPEWPRIRGEMIGPVFGKLMRGEEAPAPALGELNERVARELQGG